ncbi:MAG: SCP2 sterol-binding domain-containing protein, partial [Hyphomicrobiales bacterium]
GLAATYHFTFTGAAPRQATIAIADRQLKVKWGLVGKADLAVTADSAAWLRFLRKEMSLPWALISRRIRLSGDPRLLAAFARCFPM